MSSRTRYPVDIWFIQCFSFGLLENIDGLITLLTFHAMKYQLGKRV